MRGLGQVIVRAHFKTGHFIVQLGFGGEHEDGEVGGGEILPQAAGHFVAVHVGHHHVQQHQVGLFFHGFADPLLPVGGGHNLIALPLKH